MIVLSCGSNGNYQLGNGTDDDSRKLTPSKFDIDGCVVEELNAPPQSVICGGNHTFMLFANGDLFACGDNTYGQCGITNESLGSSMHIRVFTKIPGTWKSVACGWEVSVLLSTEDEMYVCGLGLKGELGLGKDITRTNLCVLQEMCHKKIQKIRSSIGLILCQAQDGTFYGWGDAKKGQFGEKRICYMPTVVEFPHENVREFNLTKNTVVLLVEEGIVSIGKNAGPLIQSSAQDPIDEFQVMWSSIHYKQPHTIAFEGNNSHGQRFPGPIDMADFSYAVGSEHGIVRVNSTIYAWGWGEHGNCGISPVPGHDQITFNKLNLLYKGTSHLIACGCATTWVVV